LEYFHLLPGFTGFEFVDALGIARWRSKFLSMQLIVDPEKTSPLSLADALQNISYSWRERKGLWSSTYLAILKARFEEG
jgi:hypothetical protein